MKPVLYYLFLVMYAASFPLAACPVDVDSSLQLITTTQGIEPEQLAYNGQLWSAHQDIARKVWRVFQSGASVKNQLQSCVRGPIKEKTLNYAINEIFFRHSVEGMRQLNPELFERMIARKNIFNLAFSVLNRCEACSRQHDVLNAQRNAHFNHSTQAILADVARLSFTDWSIIFIHEIGHYFFPDTAYSNAFLNRDKMVAIEKIVNLRSTEDKLSSDERNLIDAWLMDGIRTKLISEWQVWSFTLNYVKDIKDIEFGANTNWLKRFHQLPADTKYIELFKSLEGNFEQPTEGMESHPIILQRLIELRKKLLNQVESHELTPEFKIL